MTSYRRDGKSYRTHNHQKNRGHRSGQSRGYLQDYGQVNSHSGNPGNPYASGHHGGVPPSPASSAPAAAPGMRLGAAHNPSGTRTRASQVPSAPANDSSTAARHTRPVRRQHCRGHLRLFRKILVYLLPACPIMQHNCLCYEPTGSYAVGRKFSRCSTGEWSQCRQRGSPQPGYNFDEGNTRLVRRSPRP